MHIIYSLKLNENENIQAVANFYRILISISLISDKNILLLRILLCFTNYNNKIFIEKKNRHCY